jgi:magnesium-dependent phosphatase 1
MEGGGAAATAAATGTGQLPKVVVFDLDGCVWWPEMYMLWGGGPPFSKQPNGDLKDSSGTKTYLMGAVREIMHELKTAPRWAASQVAVASSCDEPAW